ncbi:hypothetical protein Gasu2_58430 [Galdieria sulphuraria]|nr:hypothetical protein Gasu2_58430 [Galdieria sulphuraria]
MKILRVRALFRCSTRTDRLVRVKEKFRVESYLVYLRWFPCELVGNLQQHLQRRRNFLDTAQDKLSYDMVYVLLLFI